MGGAPWKIPHVYHELSATSHVTNVETSVLILHGENGVPLQPFRSNAGFLSETVLQVMDVSRGE